MPAPSSPVLAALTPRERQFLFALGAARTLRAREILCLAGDEPERIHLVLRGALKLAAHDADGAESIVALAVAGDLVGDVAALSGCAQPLDVVASCRTDVLGFDASRFLRLLGENATAALEVARYCAERTSRMYETMLERATADVPARLAGRLIALADLLGRRNADDIEIELPLGQQDLGRLADMSRESTCKTLRRFKRSGMVDYEGRQLRILRPDLLERIRCGARAGGPSR